MAAARFPSPELPAPDAALISRFLALADTALADPAFSVATTAQQLGYSERTFYRHFRRVMGVSPAAYLLAYRFERAHLLLRTGAVRSVAEAAYAVGYDDPTYFARRFYRRFGVRAAELLP